MKLRILGSAAGGGFPQWNCGCANCQEVRRGGPSSRSRPRTQDSVALSGDGEGWFLLNCSPEVRQQIESAPPLHPRGPRHSPVQAVVLTNGDLDHCLGLFSLRESHPLVVYATETVWTGLWERNVIARTLQRFDGQVTWRRLTLGRETELSGVDGKPGGPLVLALPVPGKRPVHLDGPAAPCPEGPEDNVGLWLRDQRTGGLAAYVPGAASASEVREHLGGVACLLLDGTFWSEDELVALGLSTKRARDMAHLPVGGPEGSLAALSGVPVPRRIYTHINNTNPILLAGSPERLAVERAGWEVAHDGLEVEL